MGHSPASYNHLGPKNSGDTPCEKAIVWAFRKNQIPSGYD